MGQGLPRVNADEIVRRKEAMAKPIVPKIIKVMAAANVRLFRLTHGRIGGTWRIGAGLRKPAPILLLDHTGRRSGQRYTTPLVYAVDGEDLLVVGSQGGLPKHPQWFHNLRATPETQVQLRTGRGLETRAVRARVASTEERPELWRKVNAVYADFDSYQLMADRVIPVVVLEPRQA